MCFVCRHVGAALRRSSRPRSMWNRRQSRRSTKPWARPRHCWGSRCTSTRRAGRCTCRRSYQVSQLLLVDEFLPAASASTICPSPSLHTSLSRSITDRPHPARALGRPRHSHSAGHKGRAILTCKQTKTSRPRSPSSRTQTPCWGSWRTCMRPARTCTCHRSWQISSFSLLSISHNRSRQGMGGSLASGGLVTACAPGRRRARRGSLVGAVDALACARRARAFAVAAGASARPLCCPSQKPGSTMHV